MEVRTEELTEAVKLANEFREDLLDASWKHAPELAFVVLNHRQITLAHSQREDLADRLIAWHAEELRSRVNEALKGTPSKVRIAKISPCIYGSFVRTVSAKSIRGAELLIQLEYPPGCRPIKLRSVLRIRNKKKTYSILCNGQPSRNTESVVGFFLPFPLH